MQTAVVKVDPYEPSVASIEAAARLLQSGELVAFPTETVYGLGANALDESAVQKIFLAKGRPHFNPLIVHVRDAAHAQQLACAWPPEADLVAERFWPGPLTLVVPKSDLIPDLVSAGLSTVALRVPKGAVASMLLMVSRLAIAAPSANLSNRVSSTTAAHVLKQFNGQIPMVLDGGPTTGGLESTVLDLSGEAPAILRLGPISPSEIGELLGFEPQVGSLRSQPASPGMMPRHYSPISPLRLVQPWEPVPQSCGALTLTIAPTGAHHLSMPSDPTEYAKLLYSRLHELDDAGVSEIVVELPPDLPKWAPIRDRLFRAAGTYE